jgi:hypothetical protein
MYFTYREENRTFEQFGLWQSNGASVTGIAEPEMPRALIVTYGVLDALGVPPLLGRWFSQADDTPGSPETVILTYGYWQRRFGGHKTILGHTLTVDGKVNTIIGQIHAASGDPVARQCDVHIKDCGQSGNGRRFHRSPDTPTADVTVSFATTSCAPITVSPTSLPDGALGSRYGPVAFSQSGGSGTITWSATAGVVPPGLALSTAGVLSGTPTQPTVFVARFTTSSRMAPLPLPASFGRRIARSADISTLSLNEEFTKPAERHKHRTTGLCRR